MPTLLVTKKMPAELAARIERSLAGRRPPPGGRFAARSTALLRFGLLFVVATVCVSLVSSFRRTKRDTQDGRAALLARLHEEVSSVTERERETTTRVNAWLRQLAGKYEGDQIASELTASGALDRTLSRPLLYIRGPLTGFESPAQTAVTAVDSYPDAFTLCLLSPPAERSEKRLRAKARAARVADGDAMRRTAHVARLHDALAASPIFEAAWAERVAYTTSLERLEAMGRELDRAPLAGAKRAMRASFLLVVLDEPGDSRVPAELDGERPHEVRVGLVDLARDKLLLRLRRPVDPSWLSAASRAELARDIDACSLALDVRAAVTPGHEARGD